MMDPPPADISTGYEFLDSIMRCGLYLGAFFQIICLAAVVMVPDRAGDPVQGKEVEGSDDEISDHSTPQATPRRPPHTHHRQRRQEKKKRR